MPDDNQAGTISPNFRTKSMRMALFDTAHEKPIPLQLDGMFESAGIVGDTPDATAVSSN